MLRILLLLTACAFVTSCGKPAPDAKSTALPAVADTKITLKTVNYPQLDEYVVSQKGNVVLVDIWGITCVPCMKKFPFVVQLSEKYKEQGLRVVTVSTDLPESEPKILKFLEEKKAKFANFLIQDNKPSKDLDDKYPMSLQPTVILIGRDGKQAKVFEVDLTDEGLEKAVVELLGK